MKRIKITLAATRRTDLCCIACGNFRTDLAIVPIGGDATKESVDSVVGIHRDCIDKVHTKRGS